LQTSQLLHTACNDDLPAATKLASYLCCLNNFCFLKHVSLVIYTETLGFQCVLQEKAIYPYAPSPARSVLPYSVVHQLSEIIENDPEETTAHFSTDDSLPPDLQALADSEVRFTRQLHPHRSCTWSLYVHMGEGMPGATSGIVPNSLASPTGARLRQWMMG
jgi:hypothetical protein